MKKLLHCLRLLRVKHYIKNGLLFAPLLFSGQLTDWSLLFPTILGFVQFSLASSMVYVFNDLRDRERDKQHPIKKERPLASGALGVKTAWVLLFILLSGVAVMQVLADLPLWSLLFLSFYLLLNLGYSLGLKNVPILDIALLCAGYILRVLYGSAISEIRISNWLYLTVITLSFFMGLAKRRNELQRQGGNSRKVLQYYNMSFLDKNLYLCLALAIAFYSLWSVDPITQERLSTPHLVWTVPLVILMCMRYSLHIEGESDADPVEVLLHDKWLLAMTAVFGLVTMAIIYL